MNPLPGETLHEFVLRGLRSRGELSIRAIAESSNVSQRTLEKILSGEIADPGVSHIEKLVGYFRAKKTNLSCARK